MRDDDKAKLPADLCSTTVINNTLEHFNIVLGVHVDRIVGMREDETTSKVRAASPMTPVRMKSI